MKRICLLMLLITFLAITTTVFSQSDDTLLVYYRGPQILNPHLAANNVDIDLSGIFYEPLATIDNEGNIIPVLAVEVPTLENEELAADGTYVIWKLRNDVLWHDGEKFTSDDVVFTYNYVSNPEVGATTAGDYTTVDSVEAIDDYTVKVNFKGSNPAWFVPFVGFHGMILPEHLFADYAGSNSREAEANIEPIGTGPYVLTEFEAQDHIIVTANQNYWQEGKPRIKNVQIKDWGQLETSIRAVLQTGEADIIPGVNMEWKVLESMLAAGKGNLTVTVGSCVERILLNWTDPNITDESSGEKSSINHPHPILTDVNVRKAITLAVDRSTIADQLYGLGGIPTCNVLVYPTQYSSPNTNCDYNLEESARLLDEAGWIDSNGDGIRDKDGIELSLVFSTQTNAVRQQTQQIIKQALNSIGIEVELRNVDGKSFFSSDPSDEDSVRHLYVDMAEYNECGYSSDPGVYMAGWTCAERAQKSNNWSGKNLERYCNPKYDELVSLAQSELDTEKRKELFWKMNDMLVSEDVSLIPIVTRTTILAYNNRVKGVDGTGLANDGVFWNIEDWHF